MPTLHSGTTFGGATDASSMALDAASIASRTGSRRQARVHLRARRVLVSRSLADTFCGGAVYPGSCHLVCALEWESGRYLKGEFDHSEGGTVLGLQQER